MSDRPLLIFVVAGRKLLDFTSGIGVTNTGHCHPKVVKAAQDQVRRDRSTPAKDFVLICNDYRRHSSL
jgi:4-aminobutyrate aminotransferase-like enzyme